MLESFVCERCDEEKEWDQVIILDEGFVCIDCWTAETDQILEQQRNLEQPETAA